MGVKIEGDFSKLEKLKEKINELSVKKQLKFEELFTNSFMLKHTKLSSFAELLEAGGFQVTSAEDFKNIPDETWDICISKNTSFNSWKEMQHQAVREYLQKNLKL